MFVFLFNRIFYYFLSLREWRVAVGREEEIASQSLGLISTHRARSLAGWAVSACDLSEVGASARDKSHAVDALGEELVSSRVSTRATDIDTTAWLRATPSLQTNKIEKINVLT